MASARPYLCRFCGHPLRETFVDLGMSPLCQTHIEPAHLNEVEPFYPLHSFVCERCDLVQLPEHVQHFSRTARVEQLLRYGVTFLEFRRLATAGIF